MIKNTNGGTLLSEVPKSGKVLNKADLVRFLIDNATVKSPMEEIDIEVRKSPKKTVTFEETSGGVNLKCKDRSLYTNKYCDTKTGKFASKIKEW